MIGILSAGVYITEERCRENMKLRTSIGIQNTNLRVTDLIQHDHEADVGLRLRHAYRLWLVAREYILL